MEVEVGGLEPGTKYAFKCVPQEGGLRWGLQVDAGVRGAVEAAEQRCPRQERVCMLPCRATWGTPNG